MPLPETIAFCADETVIGAPFYLMREVEGVVLRSEEDAAQFTFQQRRTLGTQLVDVLIELHKVNPDDVGLGDLGRRGGYAGRQLRTWSRQ